MFSIVQATMNEEGVELRSYVPKEKHGAKLTFCSFSIETTKHQKNIYFQMHMDLLVFTVANNQESEQSDF